MSGFVSEIYSKEVGGWWWEGGRREGSVKITFLIPVTNLLCTIRVERFEVSHTQCYLDHQGQTIVSLTATNSASGLKTKATLLSGTGFDTAAPHRVPAPGRAATTQQEKVSLQIC